MLTPPTKPIPDKLWSEIALAGSLTDEYRDHLQEAVNGYLLDEIRFRTSAETKAVVGRALTSAENLGKLLSTLLQDPGYHWAARATNAPSPEPHVLEDALSRLATIQRELKNASERLNIRKWEIPWNTAKSGGPYNDSPLLILISKLLQIQALCLRTPPPTKPSLTSASGNVRRFRDYLQLCIDFASDGAVGKAEIDRDLLLVTDRHEFFATDILDDEWADNWQVGNAIYMHKSTKKWPEQN